MVGGGAVMKFRYLSTVIFILLSFLLVHAQAVDRKTQLGGNYGSSILFGDLQVNDAKTDGAKPLVYEIILYNIGNTIVARQLVSPGGRYRFTNLANGQYELAVSLDHEEIARQRVDILATSSQTDFRQDLTLQWRPTRNKPGTVSADYYKRTGDNERLFLKAKEATDQKRYDDSIAALKQIVASDPKDYQAWSELGTVYLLKKEFDESEKAYQSSIEQRPDFFLGLMNLGRLRVLRKNFEGAIAPLTEALKLQPGSADANYYLAESYLQIKKGSKAVGYFYEALKIDPVGKAEAHLRLATLYNAVGLKDKAAAEYVEFLKKVPTYPDKKKLEEYISANKKP
jgi:tetratricopeptide (TPR) repeat protein